MADGNTNGVLRVGLATALTAATLEVLAKRIGFRTVRGFGERVIFRELYLQGLTLMDVKEVGGLGIHMGMSHVAARNEVRALLAAIRKPAPPLVLSAAQ